MFVIDFDPVILDLGVIEIRYYSVFYLLGFLLLYVMMYRERKRLKLSKNEVENFVFYSMLGIVFGARLGYFLFYDIGALVNPLEFFMIWQGGMSFHGGLAGFILASYLFSRRKTSFFKLADLSTFVAIFALMLGRLGNFINGELAGTPFQGEWCMIFPIYDSVCRHPYPLYAALSHLVLLGYLLGIQKLKKPKLGSGIISVNFLIGYGLLRIITDIWKVDASFLGIKHGQWLSIFMIAGGLLLYSYLRKDRDKPLFNC